MRGPLGDRASVEDMLRHVRLVIEDTESGPSVFDDRLVREAVLWKLAIIGEAANRVSPELRERHPDVPWRRIVGQRNILVHAYDRLDIDKVWQAVDAARRLEDQLAAILQELPDWPD